MQIMSKMLNIADEGVIEELELVCLSFADTFFLIPFEVSPLPQLISENTTLLPVENVPRYFF